MGILDSILEGIQVIGRDWRYLHVNDVAARHGRTTKELLIGRPITACYPGIDRTPVWDVMLRAMTDRTSQLLENEFVFPDGSRGHFELRIHPVPQGICILSIDVTARKEAEEARRRAENLLHHAQRMEAIGRLASGVAHDFNNLLTVILSQSEIAAARATGPVTADIDTIASAATTAAGMTRQLLAYTRQAPINRGVVDLGVVLDGLRTILERSIDQRIELVVDTSRKVPPVDADRSQVEQIVMNLVLNARDAITGRGCITIALDEADLDASHLVANSCTRPGPHSVLVVRDTGTGMDAATQARMFEPFFTTKPEGRGTGLGLATVYGNVQQHGGAIRVHSVVGTGTTFEVFLPCARQPAVERSPRHNTRVGPAGPATILVVDDTAQVGQLIRMMLAENHHVVMLATSAEEALHLWKKNRHAIDLVITDSRMPGMSGHELVRRLRREDPHLPVVCTSAHAPSDLRGAPEPDGSVAFLEKPFTRASLAAVVAAALGHPPRDAPPIRK
ncbi:MAG: response regulator [Planctomycetes bacterium]|nr:response regulator [Planctomycetota bacterium]